MERPYNTTDVDPEVLRRVLPDHDGEFFALLAEREQLLRSYHDPETGGYKPGYMEADEELLDRICLCPVVTDIGAAMRLEMISDSFRPRRENMTPVRQRMLLQGAWRWLVARIMDRSGRMETRAVDIAEVRANLLAMAVKS
jgi:hypothetical protein